MLIDSHCHLDFTEFDTDRNQVIARAAKANVTAFIVPGINRANWQRQLRLAQAMSGALLAFGIHPYFLDDFCWQDLGKLESMLGHAKCIGLGECGIDGVVADIELQKNVFVAQVELANRYSLPLIVHHRRSHHLIQAAFKQVKPEYGGIIHAFSGSMQDAKKYLDLGFKLGCGGVITYDRAEKTRLVFKSLGLAHLVLETDSPSMPLDGYQGQRNEPARIAQVVASLRELTGCDREEIADVTTANVKAIFSLTNELDLG